MNEWVRSRTVFTALLEAVESATSVGTLVLDVNGNFPYDLKEFGLMDALTLQAKRKAKLEALRAELSARLGTTLAEILA